MSDSEDDKPLAARNIAVKQPAAPKTSTAAASSRPSVVSASNPDAIRRKAAQKAPVIDTSDSEDDKVLQSRAKPAARPGSGGAVKRNPSNADAKMPKPKSVPIKKEAVKIEPLSPKSEPQDLPQQGKKPRAKKGEGEKRVIVKKEYEKPGQTRETPSEIDPLRRFYSTLREQRPDSEMAKKWCLVHGILDDEEAEQIAAELKLKKGQLRSPSRPTPQKRKAPAAATRKPTATKAASKSKVEQESSDEDDFSDGDEFIAPTRKVQKQGSGTTAGGSSRPKAANGQGNNKGASEAAASAQPARAPRPASGNSRPSSREGSQAAGPSRPASGGANRSGGASKPTSVGAGTAAGDRPAAKPSRPLVASTTKDKAFADGGLDPISDSEDEIPLARRRLPS